MTDSLYKPTLPIEPGRYWWRDTSDSEPEVVEFRVCEMSGAWIGRHFASWVFLGQSLQTSRVVGLFGPRVEMPIAEPVERFAVIENGRVTFIDMGVEYCRFQADGIDGAKVVRGFFTPTEIVE